MKPTRFRLMRDSRLLLVFLGVAVWPAHYLRCGGDGAAEVERLVRTWQLWGVSDHRFGREYCGVCEQASWSRPKPALAGVAPLLGGSVHSTCAARVAEPLRGAKNLLSTLAALSPQPHQLSESCGAAFISTWARTHERQTIADVLNAENGQDELRQFANGPGAQAMVDRALAWTGGSFREPLLRKRFAKWCSVFVEEPAEPLELIEERARLRDVEDEQVSDEYQFERQRVVAEPAVAVAEPLGELVQERRRLCEDEEGDEIGNHSSKCRRRFARGGTLAAHALPAHRIKRREREEVDVAGDESDVPRTKRRMFVAHEQLVDVQQVAELFRQALMEAAIAEEHVQPVFTYGGDVASDDVPVIRARKRHRLAEAYPS